MLMQHYEPVKHFATHMKHQLLKLMRFRHVSTEGQLKCLLQLYKQITQPYLSLPWL